MGRGAFLDDRPPSHEARVGWGRRVRWCALCMALASVATAPVRADFNVLAFDKTAGFAHTEQIAAGRMALTRLGAAHGFSVDFSDDEQDIAAGNLAQYDVVVFLFTSGDILAGAQETAFEAFVMGGGGFVGIHSATDTEYNWAFYGDLVGAYFSDHPAIQEATVRVVDGTHPSTSHLAQSFSHSDEWYNFAVNPALNPNLEILLEVDESTYSGGTHGAMHPVAWTRTMGAGRAWYTAMGHTLMSDGDYQNGFFDQHLLGGLQSVVPVPEPGAPAAASALAVSLWVLARRRGLARRREGQCA